MCAKGDVVGDFKSFPDGGHKSLAVHRLGCTVPPADSAATNALTGVGVFCEDKSAYVL